MWQNGFFSCKEAGIDLCLGVYGGQSNNWQHSAACLRLLCGVRPQKYFSSVSTQMGGSELCSLGSAPHGAEDGN